MTSLVNHRGTDIDHARHDPALALVSLFRPICRGRRPGGLQFITQHDGYELRFNVWQALDVRDQSVLLAAVGLAGMEHQGLHSDVSGPVGQQLWLDLEPAEQAQMDRALVVTTTRYVLLQAAGMPDQGKSYGLLENCLERLSMVGCRARKDGYDWSMRLLSYAESPDGTLHIALNSRFAEAIAGHHVRVSLQERRTIHGDTAQVAHAWLSAWLRPGATNTIRMDNLAEKVWGAEPVRPATRRSRRDRLHKALDEIGRLQGWSIKVAGRGERAKATITRPRLIESG